MPLVERARCAWGRRLPTLYYLHTGKPPPKFGTAPASAASLQNSPNATLEPTASANWLQPSTRPASEEPRTTLMQSMSHPAFPLSALEGFPLAPAE